MQVFQDTATQQRWAFEADVVVTNSAGGYSFKTASGVPLSVPTTLQPYSGPAPTLPVTAAMLQAHALAKATALLATMRDYSVSGGPVLKSDATQGTRTDLSNLIVWGTANPSATMPWTANDGSRTTFTGAQIAAVAPLVGPYALAVWGDLAAVLDAVDAGTITTAAQIDAHAWTV